MGTTPDKISSPVMKVMLVIVTFGGYDPTKGVKYKAQSSSSEQDVEIPLLTKIGGPIFFYLLLALGGWFLYKYLSMGDPEADANDDANAPADPPNEEEEV